MIGLNNTTSMSVKIKELLLRAWRERWSDIDWGRNIKRLLPRGVSGDVYDLADCILRQAITGPLPNSLLMSYLNHCLNARIVSFGAVILAITKIQDPKPQCVNLLLEFILKYKSRADCYGNEDECLALCRSLVSLLHWIYTIINSLSVDVSDSTIHLSLSYSSQILSYITDSSFLKCLLYIGKLEEPALWSQWCKLSMEVNSKLQSIQDKSLESILAVIRNFPANVEWLSVSIDGSGNFLSSAPIISVAYEQMINDPCYLPYRPIAYRCLQAVVSFAAVLDPPSSNEVIANQIAMIGRFFDLSMAQLFSKTLHVCLVGLIDVHVLLKENLKNINYQSWNAFFLFKIPQIFASLSKHSALLRKSQSCSRNVSELELGLQMLLEQIPLLDLFNLRYQSEYWEKLFEAFEKNQLLSNRSVQQLLEMIKSNPSPPGQVISTQYIDSTPANILILRAEQTVMSVLAAVEDISHNLESCIGLMYRMYPTFNFIMVAAATNGILPKFTKTLVELNELNKVSTGENIRTSQIRAVLFDFTFLSLCRIAQNYGVEVFTQNPSTSESFFAKWCGYNFPNQECYSPDLILDSYGDLAKLQPLISQLVVSSADVEFKTSLVRWNDMVMASQLALRELLSAWNHVEEFPLEIIKLFLERLKGKLCCLAVAAMFWLFAQLKVVDESQRSKILSMLSDLQTPMEIHSSEKLENGTDPLTLHYKQRSELMTSIMKHMFEKYLPSGKCANAKADCVKLVINPMPIRLSKTSLNELLDATLKANKGHFSVKTIYEFDGLMALGGARWFTNQVVNSMFQHNEVCYLQEAVDFAFGLFHLDLEQCALVLLREIMPRYLLFKPQEENINEPKVSSLVKLSIITTFAAISQLDTFRRCKLSRRCGSRRNYEQQHYPLQTNLKCIDERLENTSFNYERRNSLKSNNSKPLVDGKDGGEAMQVDDCLDSAGQVDILSEPLYLELIHFFHLLLEQTFDNTFGPRSLVPIAILEQIVLCLREDSSQFLRLISFQLLKTIVRAMPNSVTFEQLLAYIQLDNSKGRKIGARLLCQLQLAKTYGN